MSNARLTPNQRREKQEQQLDVILNLPPNDQAGAVYGLWPHQLPNTAKRRLNCQIKNQWKQIRAGARAMRQARQEDMLMMASVLKPQQRMLLAQVGYNSSMMNQYRQQAKEVLSLACSVRNEKILSIGLSITPGQEFNFYFDAGNDDMTPEDPKMALPLRLICVAIANGGVFLVHQRLPMKTQVPGRGGEFEWKSPERLHAVYCGDGRWEPLAPGELRQVHQAVEKDTDYASSGVLTFGKIEELDARGGN